MRACKRLLDSKSRAELEFAATLIVVPFFEQQSHGFLLVSFVVNMVVHTNHPVPACQLHRGYGGTFDLTQLNCRFAEAYGGTFDLTQLNCRFAEAYGGVAHGILHRGLPNDG